MDLALGYGEDENPLIAKSEFVLSFIEQIMGGTGKLEAVDKSLIDRCLTNIYADYLDSGYSIEPPTLVDLHKELKKQKEKQAKNLRSRSKWCPRETSICSHIRQTWTSITA